MPSRRWIQQCILPPKFKLLAAFFSWEVFYKDDCSYRHTEHPPHCFQMHSFGKLQTQAFLSPTAGTAKQFIFINFVLLKTLNKNALTRCMKNKTNWKTGSIYKVVHFCLPPRSTRYNNGNEQGRTFEKYLCLWQLKGHREAQQRCILIWQSPQRDRSEKDNKYIPQWSSPRNKCCTDHSTSTTSLCCS